jgi:hypothetical protein
MKKIELTWYPYELNFLKPLETSKGVELIGKDL